MQPILVIIPKLGKQRPILEAGLKTKHRTSKKDWLRTQSNIPSGSFCVEVLSLISLRRKIGKLKFCSFWLSAVIRWRQVVKKKKNKVGGCWIPNTLTSCPFGPNLLSNFSPYIDLCNTLHFLFTSFGHNFLDWPNWIVFPQICPGLKLEIGAFCPIIPNHWQHLRFPPLNPVFGVQLILSMELTSNYLFNSSF